MPAQTPPGIITNAELHTPEITDVIGNRPAWIIRKGSIVFACLLVLLLFLTWLLRYPDIIKGNVRLIATNPPRLLIAQTEGTLKKILVINEQEVQQGQHLAFLQSTAEHQQVITLQTWIRSVEQPTMNDQLNILLTQKIPVLTGLGEIQSTYQDFQNTLQETTQLLNQGYYLKKKEALKTDISFMHEIQDNTMRQRQLLLEDFALQQNEFRAKETLLNDKVIAPLEFNQDKGKIIAKEQTLEQQSAQLINNNINRHNKHKELLELEKNVLDLRQKFRSSLLALKSKVDEWVLNHMVTAPVTGKILFVSFLQENQLLTKGEQLFYIQPPQSSYYGELMAAQSGLGKIKTGQAVVIKVESYPSSEFGYLTGKVEYISNIATSKDSFLIKVTLPRGLKTNYGQTLLFRNSLYGQADVVTNNRRLIYRFFGQLNDHIKR